MNERRLESRSVALGEKPADLVLTNARIVDVWSRRVHPGGVAIAGDRIAAVGEVDYSIGDETQVIDVDGRYLAPGFIECHIHVGASQLNMTELAKLLVAHGTAALCTDFYEIATVAGPEATRFCADEISATPLRLLFSSAFFSLLGNGMYGNPGVYTGKDLVDSVDWPEIVATREWNGEMANVPVDALHEFMAAADERGLIFEGHLEGREARSLQAAVAYAAHSDHEMATAEETLERIRLGLAVQIRQGSSIWNLEDVLSGLAKEDVDLRSVMFSTDEMDADEIADQGFLERRLKIAVECGVDPLAALQMATLNPAQFFGITDDLGSLTPGRSAFAVVLDDLENFTVCQVIAGGRLIAEDGRYLGELERPEYPASAYSTINVASTISAASFRIDATTDEPNVRCRVIRVAEGTCITAMLEETLAVLDGEARADPERDLAKIALIDRNEASGRIGKGFIKGLGLERGAFGTTFNPGICDLLVVGTNDEDMAVVANRLIELNGGYAAAIDGRIAAELPLPLWGMLSDQACEEAVDGLRQVHRAIREELGSDFRGIHTGAGFTCLAVSIPDLKLSSYGLVQVTRGGPQELVDLFVK